MAIDLARTSRSELPKEMIINLGIVLSSLIVATILWIAFVNPRVSSIEKIEKEIESISNWDEAKLSSLTDEKNHLIKEKNILSNKLTLAKAKLRQAKDISTILDTLIMIAKKRNLEFTYLKPLAKNDLTIENDQIRLLLKEIPISLELEAGFVEFLSFLWETEHGQQPFKITELTIEKSPQGSIRHTEKLIVSLLELTGEEKKQ